VPPASALWSVTFTFTFSAAAAAVVTPGVIIETTGLADPGPVAQTFFIDDTIKDLFRLDGIITVVDAKHILQHLHEEKTDGAVNESVNQVAFADRVLLNKIDLVSKREVQKIESAIRQINQHVEVIHTSHSKADPKSLLQIKAFEVDRALCFCNFSLDHDFTTVPESQVPSKLFPISSFVTRTTRSILSTSVLSASGLQARSTPTECKPGYLTCWRPRAATFSATKVSWQSKA
jgi:G3E family GTPase